MIEVKKSENESSLSLIRRFNKKIQQSGVLRRARGLQYKKRQESALTKRKKAIKRKKSKNRMEYLWKLGKIEKKNE